MADNIPLYKIVTFVDLQEMVDGGDFQQKNPFDGTSKKCCTKAECINALFLNDSGTINDMAANQLVARVHLVPAVAVLKDVMRTPGDNQENQDAKGIVSINIKHDGVYELPWVGDTVYNQNGTIWQPAPSENFVTVQRYPAPGVNDEVNIKVDEQGTGKVEWVGWVSDRNTKPYNLFATNIRLGGFTLNWNCGTQYYNLRFVLEKRQRNPDGNWTFEVELLNAQGGDGFTYAYDYGDDKYGEWDWRITCLATGNFGQTYKWDKTSDIFNIDLPDSQVGMYGFASSSVPCQNTPATYDEMYWDEAIGDQSQLQVGDYVFEDRKRTIPWPGNGNWWESSGGKYNFRIGSDGLIEGRSVCF